MSFLKSQKKKNNNGKKSLKKKKKKSFKSTHNYTSFFIIKIDALLIVSTFRISPFSND